MRVATGTEISLPEEVTLLGKGPSLDRWEPDEHPIIAVNETAYIFPCFAAVAHDYGVLKKYQEKLPPAEWIFRKKIHHNYEFPSMYLWEKGVQVQRICGTAQTALQICHYLGARVINMVGFDSVDNISGYSEKIKRISGEGFSSDNYRTLNTTMLEMIDILDLKVRWFHASNKADG